MSLEACPGDTVTLELCMPLNFMWETVGVSETGVVQEPGTYRATFQNKCGDFICVYNVNMPTCDCPVYVPTGISPNHEGINDVFVLNIVREWPITDLQFEIFDRWGNLLYREVEPTLFGWDSTHKSKPLDNGVYVWSLLDYIIAPNRNLKLEIKAGEVHLILRFETYLKFEDEQPSTKRVIIYDQRIKNIFTGRYIKPVSFF